MPPLNGSDSARGLGSVPDGWKAPGGIRDVTLASYPLERRGKVRDIFDLGDQLLIVATDRISAFDVVLPSVIPGKGVLLTAISDFWFDALAPVVPNHLSGASLEELQLSEEECRMLDGRSAIVTRADRIDIECVVRGYLAGSGWREFETKGTLAGESLPAGTRRAEKLDPPRFTPARKNDAGHDENISRAELANAVGEQLADALEQISLRLFALATGIAERAGFIIADTKFEFGTIGGRITLIDEALTPDSSRYWDAQAWAPGVEPPGFDKQVVRDWLASTGWDKLPPGPTLPEPIIRTTLERYQHVRDRLADAVRAEPSRESS